MGARRARFAAAHLGRKPGKRDVLARVLGSDDLPGGPWRVVDQRTWRTGVTGPATPWGERARQLGSVTAWRSFRNAAASRWVWIQLAPLASPEDAEDALAGIGERVLPNLQTEVRLVSERDVAIEPFPGASRVWAREQNTDGAGGAGLVLMLAAAVNQWLMVLALSGSPSWDWQAASELAAMQASRLQSED